MAAQTSAAQQPQALETPFSLAPAIFTTFSGLSKNPQPTAPEERLARILQNLSTQHEAVRRNMLGLLEARSRELEQIADEELARLGDDTDEAARVKAEEREVQSRRSREEMMRRVKVKPKEGANKVELYEAKPGDGTFTNGPPNAEQHGTGDITMGGMDQRPRSHRTAYDIRTALAQELVSLVERGVYELQAYDIHAAQSKEFYKQALERRKGRLGSISK